MTKWGYFSKLSKLDQLPILPATGNIRMSWRGLEKDEILDKPSDNQGFREKEVFLCP
jgi:hypothetical protein